MTSFLRFCRRCLIMLALLIGSCHADIDTFFILKEKSASSPAVTEWINVLGFSRGTQNDVNISSSGSASGQSKAKFAKISLAENPAITEIFRGLTNGLAYQMKLAVRRPDGGILGEVSFDDVYFSNLQFNTADGSEVIEVEIEFLYGALFWTEYHAINPQGSQESESTGWSHIQNTMVPQDFFTPTSPGITDTDGDGIPDDWEDDNQLDKNSIIDGGQNADGDQLTNFEEYIAGTDPQSANSFFRTTINTTTGAVELEWSNTPERRYRIYESTTLNNDFTLVEEVPAGVTTTVLYSPPANSGPFYKVEVILAP